MNPPTNTIRTCFYVVSFFLFIMVTACSTSGKSTPANRNIEGNMSGNHNYPVILSPAEIDTLLLIWSDQQDKNRALTKPDISLFSEILSTAIYNAPWNESGIMFKMVAPDYSLIVSYKNKPSEEKDIVMIWKEEQRLKFRNIWYTLPVGSANILYSLLDKY